MWLGNVGNCGIELVVMVGVVVVVGGDRSGAESLLSGPQKHPACPPADKEKLNFIDYMLFFKRAERLPALPSHLLLAP